MDSPRRAWRVRLRPRGVAYLIGLLCVAFSCVALTIFDQLWRSLGLWENFVPGRFLTFALSLCMMVSAWHLAPWQQRQRLPST
mmetsp:Transcript_52764/g.122806  ORF Transcript_52764/g.122806 Transcript_52764/m.122806 type:complete len:83 (-) Transcript_52764:123-371(-)